MPLTFQQNEDGTLGCAVKMTSDTRIVVEVRPCGDIYDVVVMCEDRQYDHVPSWHYDGLVVTLCDKRGKKLFSAPLSKGQASKYVLDKPYLLYFKSICLEFEYPQAAS